MPCLRCSSFYQLLWTGLDCCGLLVGTCGRRVSPETTVKWSLAFSEPELTLERSTIFKPENHISLLMTLSLPSCQHGQTNFIPCQLFLSSPSWSASPRGFLTGHVVPDKKYLPPESAGFVVLSITSCLSVVVCQTGKHLVLFQDQACLR